MSNLPFYTDKPIVCLAPMDGYTDSAFRQLVKKINPRVLVFTEMISADAICHLNSRTAARFDSDENESPLIVQLFGKNPETFAEATHLLSQTRIAGIDINMGCPARKVLKSGHGSDLIRKIDLAAEIVEAVRKNTKLPVSVKTRLGWDNADTLFEFGKKIQDAGADFITIHGRTVKQEFSGQADWKPIYELKKILKIPVIGNGDICDEKTARNRIADENSKVRLDGIMIGRATFGNPFLFAAFTPEFWGSATNCQDKLPAEKPITLAQKLPWILEHCKLAIQTKGEKVGMLEMRKHLVKYAHDVPNAARFRSRLVKVEKVDQVQTVFDEIIWESENS
ncbi:MAG: tRNA-dihydrouridine synthase family protein [Patescibacteria group bacterium]|nr:tRNA-dihydrouridine synthase family protein [Patescibacteria group bacterium]